MSETEEDVVEPEFPGVVESNLGSPETELHISFNHVRGEGRTYHTPKRDEYGDDIGNPKHPFRLDLEMPLNVPEHIT